MKKLIWSFFSILLLSAAIPAAVSAEEETSETTQPVQTTQIATKAETTAPQMYTTAVTETVITDTVDKNEQYDKILQYVGTNADDLDKNLSNNALTIDKSVIDYTDKSMYTITTRDGDIFYLIINSSDGSVYFLNSVDTSDLTAMLSDSSESKKSDNKAIKEMESIQSETSDSTPSSEQKDKPDKKKSGFKRNIIVMVIAAAIAGIAYYIFKIKPKRNNFIDEDDFDDEEINEKVLEQDSDTEELQSPEAENTEPIDNTQSAEISQPIPDMYDYQDEDSEENYDV